MSSQLQYKPVSTSCMNVYKKIAGDLSPNKLSFFTIKHPDGRIMKLGSNNMMHLNEGSDVNFQKYTGNNVQSSHLNFISFFKDGNKSYSLRHTGYVLYLHPFTAYNYDFAWYLEPEGTGFNIYNEYGGGMYIGYDEKNDQLRIVPHGSKIIWQIDEYQGNDSKKLKKALAFMNNGQGKYNNVFEDVEACVFPKETLPVMSFDNKCLLKNSDSKATINRTFIESIGGPMVQDRTIANENIRNGKGLYPSSGCGVVTNSDELFKRAVVDSGIVIDYENQKILRILREQIKALKLEIKDLTHVKIPNQHNVLNLAIRRYEHMLRDCNYHKWLKPWLINYGIPYIKRVIEQNRGYLNWLENSYWPAVNNYGKWLSKRCTIATARPGVIFKLKDVSTGLYVNLNGNNDGILDNNGIQFKLERPNKLYDPNRLGAFGISYGGRWLRHAGLVVHLHNFNSGPVYDFAWVFQPTGSGQYRIYNYYGGGYYLDFNGRNVLISKNSNRRWTISIQQIPFYMNK
jgi:hypothetical protein